MPSKLKQRRQRRLREDVIWWRAEEMDCKAAGGGQAPARIDAATLSTVGGEVNRLLRLQRF